VSGRSFRSISDSRATALEVTCDESLADTTDCLQGCRIPFTRGLEVLVAWLFARTGRVGLAGTAVSLHRGRDIYLL
jgi:hypothetical protein